MANIQSFLNQIMGARYGKDVRSSIVNAIDAVNTESNNSVTKVNAAETRVNTAVSNANAATTAANTAANSANTAAANANEAAQAVLDEKYILTATTEMVRSGTARPTAKGNAILEKLTGSSWQRKLTGKNKFDIETMLTSNATRASEYFVTNKDIQSICNIPVTAGEKYTITAYIKTPVPNESYPERLRLSVQDGKNVGYTTSNKSIAFAVSLNTEWQLTVLRFTAVSDWISISSLGLIRNDMQIELGEASTDYEPYCGATPSPNPKSQQTIRSTGDMGWFDGEWIKGKYISSAGVYFDDANTAMSKNKIPCKAGDEIRLKYHGELQGINNSNSIVFFNENGAAISGVVNPSATSTELTAIAPDNASYFYFSLFNMGIAKPVDLTAKTTVTINGKYAAIVDEVWKNLLKQSSKNTTVYDVTFTTNDDESVTVNGTPTQDVMYPIGVLSEISGERYILSGSPNGSSVVTYWLYLYDNTNHHEIGSGNSWTSSFDGDATLYIRVKSGINVPNVTFKPMIRRYDDNGNPIGDDAYVPHQSHRTYIPLDEPLRAIGDVKDEVKCVDGLYRIPRKNREVIFDGSVDEGWSIVESSNYKTFRIQVSDLKAPGKKATNFICSHFTPIIYDCTWDDYKTFIACTVENPPRFVFRNDELTTVDEWRAWLTENPIKVVYEVAETYYEEFEDQTPFYNFEAYDEVTHVSIAGLHEELQPTFTMRFPRHEDGALVTTSYCTSKKAEIRMDELSAAMLALGQL